MFFLVTDQFFLRLLDPHLQLRQLLRQPVGGAHRGIHARFVILFDVSIDQSIDRFGRQHGVGTGEPNLQQSRPRNRIDLQRSMEFSHQGGFLMRLNVPVLCRGPVGRGTGRDRFLAHKCRIGIQIQVADDQLGDRVALQNVGLRIHCDHVIVIGIASAGIGVFQPSCVGALAIDYHAPYRVINWRSRKGNHGSKHQRHQHRRQNCPLVPKYDGPVIPQTGNVAHRGVIGRGESSALCGTRCLQIAIGRHQCPKGPI